MCKGKKKKTNHEENFLELIKYCQKAIINFSLTLFPAYRQGIENYVLYNQIIIKKKSNK